MRILVPLLKLGLGGGAVYLIVDQGLFSSSQKETVETAKELASAVPSVPGLEPYLGKIPKSLSKDEMISYWNKGIKITFSTLAALPENSKESIHKGFNYLKDELKKQMQQNPGK